MENLVAVGSEYNNLDREFEVYALTHPHIKVDHRFKADGDSGSVSVPIYVHDTSACTSRFALTYNTCNGTGEAYPRPLLWARHADTDDTTVLLDRGRSGQDFVAWTQSIQFCTCP
jgi:hypothetical protein